MCAIFGSYNKDKFLELLDLNSYRGSYSYSYTLINNDYSCKTFKDFGSLDKTIFNNKHRGVYMLGHVQAPTNGLVKNFSRIHPAEKEDFKLWHNGIIKGKCIAEMQESLNSTDEWDTRLLLETVVTDTFVPTKLDNVDGAFSCVLLKENAYLMLFRNSTSPLFINDALDISSTKFTASTKTDANTVYHVDLTNRKLNEFTKFNNINNPYYFANEK